MKLILKYLKNYKLLIAANFVGVFSFALVELGIPTVLAKIIDNGITNGDISYIKKMILVMILISLVGGFGSILLGYCSSKVSTGIAKDIRNNIFEKSQEFSHTEYNKFGVSSMIVRTTNDVYQLQNFVNILLRLAFLTPIVFLISIIMTFITSAQLSLIIMATIPFIFLGVLIIAKISHKISDISKRVSIN